LACFPAWSALSCGWHNAPSLRTAPTQGQGLSSRPSRSASWSSSRPTLASSNPQLSQSPFPRPSSQGIPDSLILSHPAPPVQQHRATPCGGPLWWGGGVLSTLQAPWAQRDRQQEVLGRVRPAGWRTMPCILPIRGRRREVSCSDPRRADRGPLTPGRPAPTGKKRDGIPWQNPLVEVEK